MNQSNKLLTIREILVRESKFNDASLYFPGQEKLNTTTDVTLMKSFIIEFIYTE